MYNIIASILFGLGMFLASIFERFAYKILAGLGIGYVAYQGFDIALDQVEVWILGMLSDLPSDMLEILNLAGLDVGIRTLLAGISTFFAIKTSLGAFSSYQARGSFRA